MRALLGVLLAGASTAALAGTLACKPQAPRLDPGDGFVAFGASEQVLARGGSAGPGWEWAVGAATDAGHMVQGDLDWVSGRTYAWTLTYSGTGSAALEIRDGNALALSLDYSSGMRTGNALQLEVATNSSIGSDTTIAAATAMLNGQPAAAAVFQAGDKRESAQAAFLYYPPMEQGLTAQGTVTLSYPKLPVGERVRFRVRTGTLPCTNQAPTVSIVAPSPEHLFHAPAAIAVTADAADADGDVAVVEFFANGVPIGTATSSPFAIQWNNVAAGAYSLTTIATDNAGDRSTSAAVPILVNAPPTVSLSSPADGATFTAPASITFAAEASDTDGSIASVEFFHGETSITTLSSPPYSFVWTDVPAGDYALTARATDDRGAAVASVPVNVTVNSGVAQLYFIHVDHLNTPRLVVDAAGAAVWRWNQQEPFGSNPADERLDGQQSFNLPLRLPGQYFDKETQTNQNWMRDYSSDVGRYIQSDPAGLYSGINSYLYVGAQPLKRTDVIGLAPDGCGSGPFGFLVPNNPHGFGFETCCDWHDLCYGDCNGPDKFQCDADFCNCMYSRCDNFRYSSAARMLCRRTARDYCFAVIYAETATRAFDKSRRNCRMCKPA